MIDADKFSMRHSVGEVAGGGDKPLGGGDLNDNFFRGGTKILDDEELQKAKSQAIDKAEQERINEEIAADKAKKEGKKIDPKEEAKRVRRRSPEG
jgi:hypothetical protein